ncbi:MAG: hypothetical protein N2450_01770 [bacterium]|nr:hypothetical protein [bacterium]
MGLYEHIQNKCCPTQIIYSLTCIALLFLANFVYSQAPHSVSREPLRIIDAPTAGINARSEFNADLHMYPNGGIQVKLGIGLFRRLMMGVSYGGTNVVGRGKILENKQPGVLVKYRIFEESETLPAITGGYDNQGSGQWDKQLNRYEYKSLGVFAVASKNFSFSEGYNFGVHGSVNWNNLETDDDQGMDIQVGFDLSINEELILLAEYDFALDDYKKPDLLNNIKGSLGKGKGYLNAGLRWAIERIYLQFEVKDILGNRRDATGPDRAFSLHYTDTIKW